MKLLSWENVNRYFKGGLQGLANELIIHAVILSFSAITGFEAIDQIIVVGCHRRIPHTFYEWIIFLWASVSVGGSYVYVFCWSVNLVTLSRIQSLLVFMALFSLYIGVLRIPTLWGGESFLSIIAVASFISSGLLIARVYLNATERRLVE